MKHSRPDYQNIQENICTDLAVQVLSILDEIIEESEDAKITCDKIDVLKGIIQKANESNRIPNDEPVFLFRGQDVLLPEILSYYEKLLYNKKQAGTPLYKNLLKTINDIRNYQVSVGCKIPDAPAPLDSDIKLG